jgi:hypothetical protein
VNKVSVGVSTWALITGAVGASAAFVVGWVQTGTAPAWLAGVAAGLAGVMAWLRSWQAVHLSDAGVYIDEEPILPDDYPEADPDV